MATIMLAPLGMAGITTGTIANPDGRMTAKSKTRPRSWGLFLLSLRIGTPHAWSIDCEVGGPFRSLLIIWELIRVIKVTC